MTNTQDSPAVKSLRKEQQAQKQAGAKSADKELDKALADSFPASDPVAPATPTKAGAPKERRG
ncbi:hypothetical protein ABE438_13440 [Bosea sp. TWI1241]|jgi:hypothetical protein|uniref:hypothetical protein n=1 Tax=Bosea sp. TWI1241 TaxID=3148904 RepID=UPI00320AE404